MATTGSVYGPRKHQQKHFRPIHNSKTRCVCNHCGQTVSLKGQERHLVNHHGYDPENGKDYNRVKFRKPRMKDKGLNLQCRKPL